MHAISSATQPLALFTLNQLRDVEARAAETLPDRTLMLRAAIAIADLATRLTQSARGPIVFIAGPGNNGGDALEAALLLHQRWREVAVLTVAEPSSSDAKTAMQRCLSAGVQVMPYSDDASPLASAALYVDGMFGIGLTRELSGQSLQAAQWLNRHDTPVLAIDIPSGLDANTGCVIGQHSAGTSHAAVAVKATATLTMLGAKPGLFTAAGVDHASEVHVATLGAFDAVTQLGDLAPRGWINHPERFGVAVQTRARNTHKGTFGSVSIVGGNTGMVGALLLAGRTALYAGAGRVYLHPLGECPSVDPAQPELMIRSAENIAFGDHAVVIGPGLGMDAKASAVVERALIDAKRLVLDADALNLIANVSRLQQLLMHAEYAAGQVRILTPHPLEAARLLGTTVDVVNADRVKAACDIARRFHAEVVLKGAGSVLAFTDGTWAINITGNAGLASGGTGDVLAGLCGALLSGAPQGAPASTVLGAAVWLHGKAADDLVASGLGPIGMTASELAPAIRVALNRLVHDRATLTQAVLN